MSRANIENELARLVADLGVQGPTVVRLVRVLVRAELAAGKATEDDGADPLVPHTKWAFCSSRRAACTLARSGVIKSARRVGQGRGARWMAPRSSLDAYVEAHGQAVTAERDAKPDNDTAEPTAADVARELGLVRQAPAARAVRR